MKKIKSATLTLAFALLFSSAFGVVGCSKSQGAQGNKGIIQNSLEEISEDSLWFNYSKNAIEVFDDDVYLYTFVDTNLVEVEDGFVTTAVAHPYTFDQIAYNYVVFFDKAGELIGKVEINIENTGFDKDSYIELYGVINDNGTPMALICDRYYDEETYEFIEKYYKYNVQNNTYESLDYLIANEGTAIAMGGLNGGYTYVLTSAYDYDKGTIGYYINIGKDGQMIKSFDVVEEIGVKNIYDVSTLSKTNDSFMIEVSTASTREIVELNAEDLSVETHSWQEVFGDDEYSYAQFIGSDGKVYYSKEDGIYCADNKEEPVLPFTASYADINKLSNSRIVAADGEHFVLITVDYSNAGFLTEDVNTYIHVFDLADSNPNAGKSVITVGYIDELYPDSSSAISEFNQTSDDYYVVTKCYSADYANSYAVGMSADDYKTVDIQKSSEITNELAIDILNGEGPDVILNIAGNAQLNNDLYLLDVAPFVDEELGDIELFDNVIDASKVGDSLYQIPLTFYVEGIWAESSLVKGEHGFTFAEYEDYVRNVCNGKNPIALNASRLDVLSRIMTSMSEEFFDEDGNVDFQNEPFYEVAKYCKDNVPEFYVPSSDDLIYYDMVGYGIAHDDNRVVDVYNIDSYLRAIGFNPNLDLYGIPSNDGRGPSISIESSVAISAAAGDVDGAKELVKFLVKWDQNTSFTNSINVDVTRQISSKTIDNNNMVYDVSLEFDTPELLQIQGIFRFEYDVVDDYIDILKTASTINSMDPNIMLIVREEIQAYFADQKSIEDVAFIIQDRAQTVIDER